MFKSFSGTLAGVSVELEGTNPTVGWVYFNDSNVETHTLTVVDPVSGTVVLSIGPREIQKVQTANTTAQIDGVGAYRAICFQNLTAFRLFSVSGQPTGTFTAEYLPDDSTIESFSGIAPVPTLRVKGGGIGLQHFSPELIAQLEQLGGVTIIKAAENLEAGDIVYPSDIAMVGAETVLVASKARATDPLVTTSQLLIMEEAVLPGATGNARWFGLSAVSAAGYPEVLDPVYVSNTATLTLTPGMNSRQVGQVVEASDGLYRTLMLAGAAGGGGSPTAQVLLQTPDGAFTAGIDISDLNASVTFTDTAGVLSPGETGAPVLQRFDKRGTGVAGDAVAVAMGALKNARLVPGPAWVTAGGVVVRWIDPTDTSEIADMVFALVNGGSIKEVAVLQPNKLQLLNVQSPEQPLDIEADYNLRVRTTAGSVTLDPDDDVILNANGGLVARTNNDQEIWQPANTTIFENRIPRRKATSTLNAAPTVLDSWTPALSENYVICVETTVVGMDAAASMYITAKRVARFAYDHSGGGLTQLGSTYVPVPDDAAGGLSVDLTASGGSIAVIVTGDAATTIEWTAWTQFLITKIG